MVLPLLGQELWSHILSFCYDPEEAEQRSHYGSLLTKSPKQDTLASALRVNSSFYLAAAPHLYRSLIVDDLEAFLLGADRPVPFGVENDRDLLRHGNTKLPLLRHVQRLLIEPKYADLVSTSSGPRGEEGWQEEMEKGLDHFRSLDRASVILNRTTAQRKIMPRLQSIGTGRADYEREWQGWRAPMWMLAQPWSYASTLMTALTPKYWCEHKQSLYLELPSPTQPIHYLDGLLPDIITLHTDLDLLKYVRLVWGTTNRVCIHRDQEYHDTRGVTDEEQVIDWLETSITHSRPPWTRSSWEMTKRICGDTRVEIYGAAQVTGEVERVRRDEFGRATFHLEEGMEDEEVMRLEVHLREAVRGVYEDSLKPHEEEEKAIEWDDVIFVKRADEMPACPCGNLGWENKDP